MMHGRKNIKSINKISTRFQYFNTTLLQQSAEDRMMLNSLLTEAESFVHTLIIGSLKRN